MRLLRSIKKRLGLKRPKMFGVPYLDWLQCLRHGLALPAMPEEGRAFVEFAAPFATRSKAQLFQDLWALWEAGGRTDGFFVEIGAHDGIAYSNSYVLEQLGWRGIVAEPNPDLAAKLKANRRCFVSTEAVFSESGLVVDFTVARSHTLSRLTDINPGDLHEATRARKSRTVAVSTVSLSDLLSKAQAPSVIDFLSVDTEGSEFQILDALDFSQWSFKAISVEHNYTPAREKIGRLLGDRGYVRRWPDMNLFDDWYVPRGS